MIGHRLHQFAQRLWPLDRSLTGDGVRQTLALIGELLPGLVIHEVPSGTPAFDWTVPREWKVREAYIRAPDGRRICDFARNNLHLVGYSVPFRGRLQLADLQVHLHSLPEQPEAIPYVTSYYAERWGFCLSDAERMRLEDGVYEVVVDTELIDGHLTYAELVLPGIEQEEVMLSTYVCHPSMANNEISGIAVTTHLAMWLMERPRRRTHRIVFLPETIGSIVYLKDRFEHLRRHVIAGFNVTCVGDDRVRSYLPSRRGDSLADQVARHVLRWLDPGFLTYSWRDRGSDERQYCAPHIDLPIATMSRSLYGRYPEYHTSLDDLERVVTPTGLEGGYEAIRLALEALERDCRPLVTVLGEPQMGRRGLYPTLSTRGGASGTRLMMDLISWSDGRNTLLDIAERCEVPIWTLYPIVETLAEHGLLRFEEVAIQPPSDISGSPGPHDARRT